MVHRDPETGRFVSSGHQQQFDGVEVASFHADVGVQAADLGGGTGFTGGDGAHFEGVELLDFGDFCARNERLQLLHAEHILTVYQNSTATEDGTVRAAVEVSASPGRSTAIHAIGDDPVDSEGAQVVGGATTDDSIDIVGTPLIATGHAPFSDPGGTNVAGGGSAGEANAELHYPESPICDFYPRDELFFNGTFEVWNIDDAGVHAELTGQHIYGVIEE